MVQFDFVKGDGHLLPNNSIGGKYALMVEEQLLACKILMFSIFNLG